jgi:hypothetical protein
MSARTPDGISKTTDVADQMMNSDEICAVDKPESANRMA